MTIILNHRMDLADLAGFLNLIEQANPGDETDWLEWKTFESLDRLAQIAVAKWIIAAANRDPASATDQAEGYAYMAIGIEPGNVVGVAGFDQAKLQTIENIVGGQNRSWKVHRTTYQSKDVVIFEVAPPRPGDPPAYARSSTEASGQDRNGRPISYKVRSGEVYLRKGTRTEPADAAQMEELLRRYREETHKMRVDVQPALENALSPIEWPSQSDFADLVTARRTELMGPLAIQRVIGHKRMGELKEGSVYPYSIMYISKKRTSEEYAAEVEEYIQEYTRLLPQELTRLALTRTSTCTFVITNRSETFYPGTRVRVAFAAGVQIFAEDEISRSDCLLPDPPRMWNEPSRSFFNVSAAWRGKPLEIRESITVNPAAVVEPDRLSAVFPIIDLYADETAELGELTLLVHNDVRTPLVGKWTATTTKFDGKAEGRIEIKFDGGTLRLTSLVAESHQHENEIDQNG